MSVCRLLFVSFVLASLTGAMATLGAPLPPRQGPRDGPLGIKFARLPKGTFYMSGGGNAGKKTEITADFEIAIHMVTQGQWQSVMGNNPSWFSRTGGGKKLVEDVADEDLKQFPVEQVSWDDAQDFIKKLNEKERGSGWTYRLPTEAEWEYSCRGGATSEADCSFHFYFDKPTNDLSSDRANFQGEWPDGDVPKGIYLGRTTKVASYKSNKLGLHDMHGNLKQWCADRYEEGGSDRVFRGGAWDDSASYCRAAGRRANAQSIRGNNLGFRLARVPSGG